MGSQTIFTDICILGGGIAGVMTAHKISGLGYKTLLIEENNKIGAGASTLNEGWLHRGTYHSQSIPDIDQAIQVAKRCIYGHEQLKSYAPESIEDTLMPGYAIVRNNDRRDMIIERWKMANISHKEVSHRQLTDIEPTVNPDNIGSVFQVSDTGINTRILFAKMTHDFQRNGGKLLTNTRLYADENNSNILKIDTGINIEANIFIFCIGNNVKKFFQENFGIDIPLRLWKSHLLVTQRAANHSIFYLDPGEAGMMNHGKATVFGMNEDAVIVDRYDNTPIEKSISNIRDAIGRSFYMGSNYQNQPVACIKVDLAPEKKSARSLAISITEPKPGYIVALPGKMTEIPYMTDMIVQMVFERLGAPYITKRPLDDFLHNNIIL